MRSALGLCFILTIAGISQAETRYSNSTRIRIPVSLSDSGPAVSEIWIYYASDRGGWELYKKLIPGDERAIIFESRQDGVYSFATMVKFRNGGSDPASVRDLVEQHRIVIDTTKPVISYVRSSTANDGAPGIEWEVTDAHLGPRPVRLMYRWANEASFKEFPDRSEYPARGKQHWRLEPSDRLQVKVVARDRAGNESSSEPVWITPNGFGGSKEIPGVGTGRDPVSTGTGNKVQPASTPNTRLVYLNKKEITLTYDVETGPSGITGSRLFAANQMLEWKEVSQGGAQKPKDVAAGATVAKLVSLKFEQKVEQDGEYNYIIVAENHNGPNRPFPKPKDPAEITVIVDTTPPTVAITNTRVSQTGDRTVAVDIRYTANDKYLAPVPIMIEFSPKKDGIWKPITNDWVDNTGQMTWTPPTGEGHEFYIRVRCRDRASNEGVAITDKPVNIDLFVPRLEYKEVIGGPGIINAK